LFVLASRKMQHASTPEARAEGAHAVRAAEARVRQREVRRATTSAPTGDTVDRVLFELDHLQIGMPGARLRIERLRPARSSSSRLPRPKVVVLDFWGYW
jgi:hypothetical protein